MEQKPHRDEQTPDDGHPENTMVSGLQSGMLSSDAYGYDVTDPDGAVQGAAPISWRETPVPVPVREDEDVDTDQQHPKGKDELQPRGRWARD